MMPQFHIVVWYDDERKIEEISIVTHFQRITYFYWLSGWRKESNNIKSLLRCPIFLAVPVYNLVSDIIFYAQAFRVLRETPG